MKRIKPMSPQEKLYWEITDFKKKLDLLLQEIAPLIPARTTSQPKGYVIDPETGKKIYYGKNAA